MNILHSNSQQDNLVNNACRAGEAPMYSNDFSPGIGSDSLDELELEMAREQIKAEAAKRIYSSILKWQSINAHTLLSGLDLELPVSSTETLILDFYLYLNSSTIMPSPAPDVIGVVAFGSHLIEDLIQKIKPLFLQGTCVALLIDTERYMVFEQRSDSMRRCFNAERVLRLEELPGWQMPIEYLWH